MHTQFLRMTRPPTGWQTSTRGLTQQSRRSFLCVAAMGKNDPRLWSVKQCIEQAVWQVFQGHASVQLQSSTAKGTSLQGSSDWDVFVRLNDNITTVTRAQRKAVHDQLQAQFAAAGIYYWMELRRYRIRLDDGKDMQGELPGCDVVFQRFKDDERKPPNRKALASSHAAQQVVRYIKALPRHYSNLPQPKSFWLERAVMLLVDHMRCQLGLKKQDMQGKAATDRLLTATLQAVAGTGSMQAVKGLQGSLQQAGVDGEWRTVAQRVLNVKAAHGCWPEV